MEPKHLWGGIERERVDVVQVVRLSAWWRLHIFARAREAVVIIQSLRPHVGAEDRLNESHVLVVSDTTPVVDFSSQIVQHLVGHFLVLVKQHHQLALAHEQVFVRELIGNVPADGSELPPILNDRVEEAKSENQLFEKFWLLADVKLVIVQSRIGAHQVVPQP